MLVELRDRHRDFYLDMAQRASASWAAEGDKWVAILTRELGNLRAALRWSIERADRDAALGLCTALAYFWGDRRLYGEAEDSFSRALALDGPPSAVSAEAQVALARVLSGAGRYKDAIDVLRQAAQFRAAAQDTVGLAGVLVMIGWDHHYAGEPALATSTLQQAVDLLADLPPTPELVGALRGLGWRLADEDDLVKANEIYAQAIEAATALGDQRAVATTWSVLGNLLRRLREYAEAEEATQKAAAIYERLGMGADLADALRRLSRDFRRRGAYRQADDALQRALDLAGAAAVDELLAWVRLDIAAVALEHGDTTTARREAEAAIGHLDGAAELSNDDAWLIYTVMSQLATIAYADGRIEDARAATEEATRAAVSATTQSVGLVLTLDLTRPATEAEEHGDPSGASRALRLLLPALATREDAAAAVVWVKARLAKLDGRMEDASRLLIEARGHARSVGDQATESLMLFELGVVNRERGDLPAAKSALRECLAMVEDLGFKVSQARVHLELARLAQLQDDRPAMDTHERELWARRGDLPAGVPRCELAEHLALSAARAGQVEAFARLFAAASEWRDRHAKPRAPAAADEAEELLRWARSELSPAAFSRLWAEGAATPLAEI